jgi:MFS transporter, SP family, general alpha glucoside:H+ symporter
VQLLLDQARKTHRVSRLCPRDQTLIDMGIANSCGCSQKHFDIIDEAKIATQNELKMSLWQGFRLYPKACFWSIVLSMAVIMEGFDAGLLGSFYAYPTFTKKYGIKQPGSNTYTISADWQTGLSDAVVGGYIIGLMINGWASERFGYKKTMVISLVAITGLIFMQFFAPNIQVLCGAYILIGIPLGVFQTLTTTYASEVCPVVLRGYLTSWVNICWFIGSLISQGALRGFLSRTDEWSYRLPFALQWIWPVPITIAVVCAPGK